MRYVLISWPRISIGRPPGGSLFLLAHDNAPQAAPEGQGGVAWKQTTNLWQSDDVLFKIKGPLFQFREILPNKVEYGLGVDSFPPIEVFHSTGNLIMGEFLDNLCFFSEFSQ